jgi:hypothetical protein
MARCLISIAFVAGFGASAHAAVITATYSGIGDGSNQSVAYAPGVAWDAAPTGPFYTLKAREHLWASSDGTTTSWCVQLFQSLSTGSTYGFLEVAAADLPAGSTSAGPIGATRASVAADAMFRWTNLDGSILAGSTATETNDRAAAFSVLLWELTHESITATTREGVLGQMSLSTGAFRANLSAGALAAYEQIFSSLGSGGWFAAEIRGWTHPTAQDQLVRLVPAPGAVALLGLAGLIGSRRRR